VSLRLKKRSCEFSHHYSLIVNIIPSNVARLLPVTVVLYIQNATTMQAHNDLQRIKTPLLESMINAYSADYGRLLTTDEALDRKKTIALLQAEIKSRKITDSDVPVITQPLYKFLRFDK
jgi:hypothetical protein